MPPAEKGLSPEEIDFSSSDGTKLSGWLFHHTSQGEPKAVLVFYHGNGQNLSSHYLNLLWILPFGYDFFIFDYRGYGRSSGNPSPAGTVADGEAALRWVKNRYPRTSLVIFGQSLGGAIALRNASDLKGEIGIRAVAIESSFASYEEIGRRKMAQGLLSWPLQWLPWIVLSDQFAPEGRIGNIAPVPLLVFHSENDRIVPFRCGEEIFEQARQPKEFWKIPGDGHADSFRRYKDQYKNLFLDWLNKTLSN